MTRVSMADNGWMAAVIGPYETVEKTLRDIDGYVVAANLNSHNQTVIGGASAAVKMAIDRFNSMGLKAIRIPVSHAFHTDIVAPASKPLRQLLNRLSVSPPRVPIVANVTGEAYPADIEAIKDLLERQIASPVQWAKSLETCYRLGVRAFLEVGPKKVLKGFVDNVVGGRPGMVSLFTNHPDFGEIAMFNQALCGLYAAGYRTQDESAGTDDRSAHPPVEIRPLPAAAPVSAVNRPNGTQLLPATDAPLHATDRAPRNGHSEDAMSSAQPNEPLAALAQLLAQALTAASRPAQSPDSLSPAPRAFDRNEVPLGSVVISGAGLGLPGTRKQLMDPENAARILRGEQFIDLIPEHYRKLMLDKQITRLVKAADGSGSFETITDVSEVIKLAGQPGAFDLAEEYGVPAKLIEALDLATQVAMAAGLDALREAGIPLVQTFKRTSKGTHLPDRWVLPEPLRDETGVIFASAFPGYDRFAGEFQRYHAWENKRAQLAALEDLSQYTADGATLAEIHRRIAALREDLDREPFLFDRRFILRILAMGHSQFAEYIGARGPNTQVNAACASTAHAISLAEDWIRSGRCRRVLVVSGDNVTSPHLMEWMGASFLALGASATDERVEDAALPFDRRRHGMILGIGAAALVIESEDAVRERGMRGIVEVLATETANSAYHATRLDADHISQVMERLLTAAERRFGISRFAIAPQTVFMSHETYTPARGGSASAEVNALRVTFGPAANDIVVSNTKGFTGHTMGAGVEDVVAVKILEHGIVPPVPNFREVDPALGVLNLSRGGRYPVQYGLRLAAGFGSQIAMTLTRRIPGGLARVDNKPRYQRWLADVSGCDRVETEVVKRVLRIRSDAMPARDAAPSAWQHGTGPTVRAAAPGDISAAAYRPAPMAAIAQALGAGQEPEVRRHTGGAHPEVAHSRNGGAAKTAPATREAVPSASAPPAAPAPVPLAPAEPPSSAAAPPPAPIPIAPVTTTPPAASAPAPVTSDPTPALAPEQGQRPPVDRAGASAPAGATVSVTAKVLEIVAAKTGYPQDMLDLDLDLEADLGIDTVKQAETLAAIRETFGIPVQQNLSLRDYPTLQHVIGFVYTMRPELQAAEPGSGGTAAQEPHRESSGAKAEERAGARQPDTSGGVMAKVLEIVAAKTGYPQDMLDLDLDLEADLGIDTVKQAETFAAIRETFGIPVQQNLSLRDYPTLQHVIGFVYTMRPELQAAEPGSGGTAAQEPHRESSGAKAEESAGARQPDTSGGVMAKVLEIVAAKTGYPQDMLDLDLDLEADLGIDTVKQAETFAAIRETFGIPVQQNLSLRDYPTLQHVIGFVYTMRPELQAAEPGSGGTAAQEPHRENSGARAEERAGARQPDTSGGVMAKVLEIVAAKTGYPQDMLDLDLDLEADLGIDTVKQAETFAAIRETFGIPVQQNLSLRDYPTLQHVIGFVYTMRPELQAAEPRSGEAAAQAQEGVTPASAPAQPAVQQPDSLTLAAANSIPRRVPVPALRPGIDLCKDTGVTLGVGSRVLVMPDEGGVGHALVNRLQKLGVTVLALEPGIATADLEVQVKAWLSEGSVQGVYWLPALDVEPDLEQLDPAGWHEVNRRRIKNLYTTMRSLYASVAGPGAFLVTGTRLGGLHGYGDPGATAPAGGAVVGFAKAYAMEQQLRDAGRGLLVKAVDFEAGRKTAEPAEKLIAETLYDPGVIEVGYRGGLRFSVMLAEQPLALDTGPSLHLGPDSVFVVTGAAGGITSAIVADLAAASRGVFYLLDLARLPARDDPQVTLYRQGREALKAALIEEARASGIRPTPAQIDRQLAAVERSEAALRSVEAVEAAGGTAHYHSLDLRDGDAAAAVIEDIRQRYGRIDVLIHAAGLLVDRTLPDKEPAQFDLVFDVKADGFYHLLHAARGLPIAATVAFSSVAGRFGNNGQSDYSAANDLLCKLTSSLRRWRAGTRAIALDWTAWGQIGMASRGSVPQIMEALGVDMLPPDVGVPTVRRELVCGGAGEVVVAGRLGAWLEERDATGGLDPAKAEAYLAARRPRLPMIGRVVATPLHGGVQVETPLDPKVQPFLYDHAPDEGTPWLPGVMATEALAEIASLLVPGYSVAAVENVQMSGAFKFFRMEPRTLYLSAVVTPVADGELLARAWLRSMTMPAVAELPAQVREHFVADVRLRVQPRTAAPVEFGLPAADFLSTSTEQLYQVFFHGPAYQVLECAGVDHVVAIGMLPQQMPPDLAPASDAEVTVLMAPRLIESCFQVAAFWSLKRKGAMALPHGFDSVTAYRPPEGPNGHRLYAVVNTQDDGHTFDGRVVDEVGQVYIDLRSYRTVARPV